MFKRFSKPYFIWWLLAVALLVLAEISMRNAWVFNINFHDINYLIGYGLLFDLLALMALVVGMVLFIRARLNKEPKK